MAELLQLIAPYDSRTRLSGVSNSLDGWRHILSEDARPVVLQRRFGDGIHFMVEQAVRGGLSKAQRPLLLGGDHSLTWSVARALFDRHGPITFLHFDAHPDAHPVPEINHWSVFHHIRKRLARRIIPVGYRAGCTPVSPVLEEVVTGPVYISVDVDYFDPSLVSAVTAPAPSVQGARCDLKTYSESLSQVRGPIIGADIVEWMGAVPDSAEFNLVRSVYEELVRRIMGSTS